MKNIFLTIVSVCIVSFVFAQAKQTVKVWGNCGMCKTTIEKAAKSAGASDVEWNKDTKILTVGGKADMKKIEQAIALVGYDTQNFTAKDEAYFDLPECCQYERKAASATASVDAKADCCKNGKCEKGAKGEKGCKGCKDCEKCAKGDCADCCKDGKCSKGKDCCK